MFRLLAFLVLLLPVYAEESFSLMDALERAHSLDLAERERFPFYPNYLLQGGYFSMPSARMGDAGEVAIGYSEIPPYRLYNLRFQFIDSLEISGNYRIFKGIADPLLTAHGFGDLSDKGANIKLALFRPEDSHYLLPGVAIGTEDFLGTRNFRSQYIVMTKIWLKEDFEASLGFGRERISGIFGGFLWTPFRQGKIPLLRPLALSMEWDGTPYKKEEVEKHPKGRKQKSKINFGIKTRLFDSLDLSLSYMRGVRLAGSVGFSYNLGESKGLLPKMDDPFLYHAPKNIEPIGPNRSWARMAADFAFAFDEQNFDLLLITSGYSDCGARRLRLQVFSRSFRTEAEVKERVAFLLGNLVPNSFDEVIVVIMSEGFPVQEALFSMRAVREFIDQKMGFYEMEVLSPTTEVTFDPPYTTQTLYKKSMEPYNFYLEPKTNTFFGSSKGKFKYNIGLRIGVDGFLPNDIRYSILCGLNLIGNIHDVKDVDMLNPSQVINVRSDNINYFKTRGLTLDQGYLQKNWTLGNGFYTRLSAGYFEEAYAGLYGEALWYPYALPYAFGIEGGLFKKRSYKGLGFQERLRKLHHFQPSYHRFFLSQAFINFYYRWFETALDFKVSVGKFLANDFGARFELFRYFPSGLEVYIWYTRTNGGDRINGENYHDKGIGFSMPLDIFYTYSSKERWGYGMSAWLRDVGCRAMTGEDLYNMISEERQ